MASHLDESIITGTRATSGSLPRRDMNAAISLGASSMASSMLMSTTCAPASTWVRAISTASSMLPSFMRRRNLRLPATLHRSPMLRKLRSADTSSGSSPARVSDCDDWGMARGDAFAAISAMAEICSGVVPQHPPTMFRLPDESIPLSFDCISSGVSSYSPISLGKPALG